ncbi:hypothetical protein BC833DRAFT_223125 [Globomyces pollinis-pini]|nr:hypothetical protein BC833DRAFT_223125 [Globomyces pollinis-pini]
MTSYPPKYPTGCLEPTFPDSKICEKNNWYMGDIKDPCAPLGRYPVVGEQVYIQDPANFCIMLPNPDSPTLKTEYYSQNLLPTVVQSEGYIRSFCVGDYLPPGSLKMPENSIKSAHVVKNVHKNGKAYYQISGMLNCRTAGVNCTMSRPGAYDDAGQYDSVPFRNCGKSPYSGVDSKKQGKNYVEYVEQAGNGLFCMRVCEAGTQLNDPCNVKNDTAGCTATMDVTFPPGFTYTDKTNGTTQIFDIVAPIDESLPKDESPSGKTPDTPSKANPSPQNNDLKSEEYHLNGSFKLLQLLVLLLI